MRALNLFELPQERFAVDTPERISYREVLAEFLLEELKDVGVFFMDPDRRITTWSPGIQRILGFSESDFLGQDGSFLFTPEDREKKLDLAEFDKARLQGRAPDVRWHMKQDGTRTFVDGVLRSVSDDAGAHIGYCKIMRDITPNRVEDSMLKAILDRTPDVIYLQDGEGRYTFANSETARLFGRTIEEVVGHAPEEFFPPQIAEPLRLNTIRVIEKNSAGIVEERMLTKEHGERTFLTGKAPWYDITGKIIGVVSIAQDISHRKETEIERERLVTELRRSNEDLAQFAHVVSHDLQAPLRMVHSYTELLQRRLKGKLDETAAEFISVILSGAKRMSELIQALLRYAQAGEDSFATTDVRVDAILDAARSNLQLLLDERLAEIKPTPLPTVLGDPVQLLQLFQNLISNAVKYARPGVQPQIEISAQKSGDKQYRFAVSDNGLGIDSKHFDLIFAPLRRLHGQEIPGTGIGLSVCRKIVERHGGQMWLTSELGKGSTFYFTLPAA